jgi:hypothetical protein
MAEYLMTFIKMEEDLQKKAYFRFCRQFIDLYSENSEVLFVVQIFAPHLSDNFKQELYVQ